MVRSVARNSFKACFCLGLLSAFAAGGTHAQAAFFAPENYTAWIDIRLLSAGGESNWRDGGYGKLRYGNTDAGLQVAQAALLWTPRLSDNISGNLVLQDVPDAQTPLGISEAYIQWKPVPTNDTRYSFRLGQLFLPLSLEHDGAGWTTTRTLTPSMINSWIGEEGLVRAAEAKVQTRLGNHTVGATAGLFTGDDTAGTILTFRGWAQHDIATSSNTALQLPYGGNGGYTTLFLKQAALSKPMVEVDGRGGYYLRLDWRPPAPIAFNMFYFDNPANPAIVRNGQYGWSTQFIDGGMTWQITAKNQMLSQHMWGRTKMGAGMPEGRHPADIQFESAYAMLTHSLDSGDKITARIEYFSTFDYSLVDIDNNNEKGYSATVAWMKPLTSNLDLALEALDITSNRPSRATQFEASRQAQTQVQLSLKFHL
jgi:hypothetical protein